MNLDTLRKLCKKALYLFPSRLPVGMTELKDFTNSILDTYDLPNNESMHFAIANMIMHSGNTTSHRPKCFFYKALINAMAKEVAFAREKELREERKKQQEREAAQNAEVPPEEPQST